MYIDDFSCYFSFVLSFTYIYIAVCFYDETSQYKYTR